MTDIYCAEHGDIKVSPSVAHDLVLYHSIKQYGHPCRPKSHKRLAALHDHIEATAKALWEWRNK